MKSGNPERKRGCPELITLSEPPNLFIILKEKNYTIFKKNVYFF